MTCALPYTRAPIERVIKAALKLGLPVTGVTVRADSSYTINTVEEPVPPAASAFRSVPKLRDARGKFRTG
jgi:hypothetical protein